MKDQDNNDQERKRTYQTSEGWFIPEAIIAMYRRRRKRQVVGAMIGLAGMALLWASAGPWAALGVFLVLIGNNIEQELRRTR